MSYISSYLIFATICENYPLPENNALRFGQGQYFAEQEPGRQNLNLVLSECRTHSLSPVTVSQTPKPVKEGVG